MDMEPLEPGQTVFTFPPENVCHLTSTAVSFGLYLINMSFPGSLGFSHFVHAFLVFFIAKTC